MSDSAPTDAAPQRSRRPRRASGRGRVAIGVVTLCTGLLFGVSAHINRMQPSTLGVDLPSLVSQRQKEIARQETTLQDTQQEVDQLVGTVSAPQDQAGYIPLLVSSVRGPGIHVELSDAPADLVVDDSVNANSLVVHQQDVDAVMNALWAGGAEAMTVQGVRVSPFTPVRCIGNVILVGGTAFGPPYRIEAIGNPSALNDSLLADPQVRIYLQYVSAFGMGWSVKAVDVLDFPPIDGGYSITDAKPLEKQQ